MAVGSADYSVDDLAMYSVVSMVVELVGMRAE
jgi:hypothetical protein